MTLTQNGIDYIATELGINNCFVSSGLQWISVKPNGEEVPGMGGTANVVGRLILTSVYKEVRLVSPTSKTITYSNIQSHNGQHVTLTDVKWIAENDGNPTSEPIVCSSGTPQPLPQPQPSITGLTQNGKNYIARELGIDNCIAPIGLKWNRYDYGALPVTESGGTGKLVSRLVFSAITEKVELLEPKIKMFTYGDLKTNNDNKDIDLENDVKWILEHNGLPATEQQFCAGVITSCPKPSASFTKTPSTHAENELITFNASSSEAGKGSNIVSYTWNFGDGTTDATGPIVYHSYSTGGKGYILTLTVTNACGEQDIKTQSITIKSSSTGITPTIGMELPAKATDKCPACIPEEISLNDFAIKHKEFVDKIDMLGRCFKEEDIAGFNEPELKAHLNIAVDDKYLAKTDETYCTMDAIQKLVKALKRFEE